MNFIKIFFAGHSFTFGKEANREQKKIITNENKLYFGNEL